MFRTVALAIGVSVAAWAAGPAFEVASIRPAQPGREGVDVQPGVVNMRGARLQFCLRWAYNVTEVQVAGPDWINDARFDIVAKAAGPAKLDEMRLMMQQLLADRFQVKLHRETREMSALVLTVGKGGHKLKAVETEGSPSFQTGKLNLTGKGATVGQLIDFLSKELRKPIVDQTGLDGRYDYFMDINAYMTDEVRATMNQNGPPADAPSIIAQAMQSQLGLRVDAKKMPVEVLVIDRIEKTPSEN